MDFLELAKKRYSVRKYEKRPVEKDKLEKILEAGRIAPTAANRQPQKIYTVISEEGLEKISKAADIYGAPAVFVVCSDKERAWVRRYDEKTTADIDASIITDHMMLEATELGLGTLWICSFKPSVIRAELDIPEKYEIVNLLAAGYSADKPKAPSRHANEDIRRPVSETAEYI